MITTSMHTEIRILTKSDWLNWKKMRLEALKLYPKAFVASYENEVQNPDKIFQNTLKTKTIFGAFRDGVLVGIAGFFVFPHQKMQHRGNLFSFYLRKDHRGQGIAYQLLETVIAYSKNEGIN